MRIVTILVGIAALGCSGTDPQNGDPIEITGGGENTEVVVERDREPPPESGEAREISFPPITRAEVGNGLEVNSVEWRQLPIVYLRLVVRSGGAADPSDAPGMAHLVGSMLKEGTRRRSSAQIADQVDFLGADIWVESDEETVSIGMRALSEHLDEAMELLADVTMNPAFRDDELRKLKRRELDRLSLQSNDPNFLGAREFYRALYGEHPYGRIDTTAEVVERVSRRDLTAWHRQHFVANNAFLVAVGNVSATEIQESATEAFGRWRTGTVPEVQYASPPERDSREIIVVDRPESVQSVISIGNLAIERAHADYVPLRVANQVLGGSAASRLFMDLRERRSLTYGAYSGIGESVQVAPFRARAAVRNEVTAEAMSAFFEHLDRIRTEPTPDNELQDAHRYLSDSFPLRIDTPGKIAWLVANLRIFGLADDYWDSYRSSVREVNAAQALAAAERHIRPENALVVVVGKAADITETLRRYGPVRVLNTAGEEQQRFEATQ